MAAPQNPVAEQSQQNLPLQRRPITAPPPNRPLIAPRGKNGKKGITQQQINFCEYYLQGMNAYRAALAAGYSQTSADQACNLLLDNPLVVDYINERTASRFRQMQVTTDRILEEIAKLAFYNVFDYVDIDEDGKFEVKLDRINRHQAAAISELYYDAEGRPRVKFFDKKSSLELLARIKKMLADADKDPQDKEQLTISKLDAIIQQNVTINNITINRGQKKPQLQLEGAEMITTS